MKKYIIVILFIGIALMAILIYNGLKVEQSHTKNFKESGYILQCKDAQNIERYYFTADETYKENYNKEIVFLDTNGNKVTTSNTNFVHYTDNSMSALSNGVLIDLNQIDTDPICYYNMPKEKVLTRNMNSYSTTNLGRQLKFENVLWKISDNKYLIAGEKINLVFEQDNINKEMTGYIEIEYIDNEIVKIYNQEIAYQTISSNVYIIISGNIKINLSNRIISKNDENKMSFNNMVIDSDDNVTITDLTEEENQENESSESNSTSQTVQDTNSSIINDGQNTSSTVITEKAIVIEKEEETLKNIKAPKFSIESFSTNSLGINAKIMIEDEENLLSSDTIIKILRNDTGKIVYERNENLGVYNIDVDVASLTPDTNYTLQMESSYKVEDIVYNKSFIYKVFQTNDIGIDLEKDVFTDNSLAIKVIFDNNSKVKIADVAIYDNKDNLLQTEKVNNSSTYENKQIVEFINLTSNTEYKIKILNAVYNEEIIANGFELSKSFVTLKQKPEISNTEYEINKRDRNFVLRLKNTIDKDNSIEKYRFEIFDIRTSNMVYTVQTALPETILNVDEINIFKNVGYMFRVITETYDNEKVLECESEFSSVFTMDGAEFPTIRFEEQEITYEKIEGNIIIEDTDGTIDLSQGNGITVVYTDSVGLSRSFSSKGNLIVPMSVNNLRANETYKISVYAKVDLHDGNDLIDECYIGSAIVKTKTPNNMVATFKNKSENTQNTFSVAFQLTKETEEQGILEPKTLTGLTFSIYSGQTEEGTLPTGNPKRSVKLVDTNTEAYESALKKDYFDQSVVLTPEFFGSQNKDFKEQYYTVVVSEAYDYTDYHNTLPILKNVYTIKTNGYMPDLPSDTENAINVTIIRNRDSENPRSDLDAETIIGYKIKSKYDNNELYATNIIYKAYNATTKELMETREIAINKTTDVPETIFYLEDGIKQTDNKMRRGNSYYFTYEIKLDLNNDGIAETLYPYQDDLGVVELKSGIVAPKKQEPKVTMYPSISDTTTITFAYKCTDIDNAIQESNFNAKIGNTLVNIQPISNIGSSEFSRVKFSNLTQGDLNISLTEKILDTEVAKEFVLINHNFEGIKTIQNVNYNVSLESNKAIITLLDFDNQISNIAAVKVKFTSSDQTINIEKIMEPENNTVSIGLNELEELMHKETHITVIAYYDTGRIGYELEGNPKVSYQKAYLNTDEQKYYYTINNKGQLVETTSIIGEIYQVNRIDNNLNIKNVFTNTITDIQLGYSKKGFLYDGKVVLQKQIAEQTINCLDGSNIVNFDLIVTGISLLDSNKKSTLSANLDTATFKAILTTKQALATDYVYIDLYQTDENGKNEKRIRTIQKNVNDFNSTITIDGLTPKTYYYLKFKAPMQSSNGYEGERWLYDIEQQIEGKKYTFSTLATVGIDDIEVTCNMQQYTKKFININYTLDEIFGYDKIVYTIKKYNKTTNSYENFGFPIEDDMLLKYDMEKSLDINPTNEGVKFAFGEKYKIILTPLANYTDANGITTELELGIAEKEFTLESLRNPIVAVKATRKDDKIEYKVSIYDKDRIIQNDQYYIAIMENTTENVTPEEYVNQYFKTTTYNKLFEISNVDPLKNYTILVKMKLDINNTGEDLQEYQKTYTVKATNDYGILIGDVTATTKEDAGNYTINLLFNNSYNLTQINQVKYSIYNIDGYAISGTADFTVIKTSLDTGETYYQYIIPQEIQNMENGIYYIELQFYKDNKIVDSETVEYIHQSE